MLHKFLLFIFITVPIFTLAQLNINGEVIDENDMPLPYVEVEVYENNEYITDYVTEFDGKFNIQLNKGNYKIVGNHFGVDVFTMDIELNKNTDLGKIKVDNIIELEGIVLTGKKKLIEKKVDRIVFNVENSVSATGGDALDILKITPRIKVQNDQISMIGKNSMAVMIDERLVQLSASDLANLLKTIRWDEIKSIEVITNPPARYSAEGNSGIINIVTKKQRQDIWNASLRSVYQQATYATGLGGAGLNFKKNKVTLSSNINYINGSNSPVENNTIDYSNILWEENGKWRNFSESTSARLGIDYKASDKVSTGFMYIYSNNTPKTRDHTISTLLNSSTKIVDSLIVTDARSQQKRSVNTLNYHLVYDIDTIGRKLSFDFDFFDFRLNSNRTFQTNNYYHDLSPIDGSYNSAENKGGQDITNYSFNLDMEHPFDWGILNYGARLSYINTDNNFEYYDLTDGIPVFDTSQSNHFKYRENTQAVYFSVQKEFSDQWEAKLGLRIENTQIKGNSVTLTQENKTDYTKLFPTAYLSFTPNDNHTVSLSYNRRINRPNYSFLNPFRWISSPYSYSEGNPYLQPSFSDNIEIEYIFKDNLISTFYFSHTDDGFEQVAILDDQTNIQQIIPLNFLKNKTFGFNQSVILNPYEWLNINFFGDVYYTTTDSKIPTTLQYLKGWNGNFSINNDFILNKERNIVLNISYNYITKGVDFLDYNSSFNQLNASLRASFLKKQLTASLYFNDILSSNRPTYTTYSNDIKNSFTNYYDERFFRLSIVYNFGKPFSGAKREHKNTDEIDRTN